MDELDTATINVAGIVSECLNKDVDIDAESIIDYWEGEAIEPSPTDYAGIPGSWEDRFTAVESALALLREYNELRISVVADLVQNELITD